MTTRVKGEQVTLTGRRASTGVVGGEAFFWKPGDDLSKIQEGAILVTKMTTPEILPVIQKIAGLVTMIGGVTCHAAILAREFGVPTVVACEGASMIMDGDMVIINAMEGKVRVTYG